MSANITAWIQQPRINHILHSFVYPKTPRQAEIELGLKKLKLKPFLEKGLLESLNPESRKGRYYLLSNRARKLLDLSCSRKEKNKDWPLLGWILASPKQRRVILKTLAIDSVKRTSENIRQRASKYNPCLSRISTKGILNELISRGLVMTELSERKRYYWISGKGRALMGRMD
jgi:hypothetical protein